MVRSWRGSRLQGSCSLTSSSFSVSFLPHLARPFLKTEMLMIGCLLPSSFPLPTTAHHAALLHMLHLARPLPLSNLPLHIVASLALVSVLSVFSGSPEVCMYCTAVAVWGDASNSNTAHTAIRQSIAVRTVHCPRYHAQYWKKRENAGLQAEMIMQKRKGNVLWEDC